MATFGNVWSHSTTLLLVTFGNFRSRLARFGAARRGSKRDACVARPSRLSYARVAPDSRPPRRPPAVSGADACLGPSPGACSAGGTTHPAPAPTAEP
eukprot:204651-Pyramimonas_sp.AAC.1